MNGEAAILTVITGERKGVGASALRGAFSLLAYVYTAGLKLFLVPYRLGIRKQFRLPCPVISIGNLTVGGTGKTSMTVTVCTALKSNGQKVCVLNRGYKGACERGEAVVSDETGVKLGAEAAGDEAYMLASMLQGVPVIVGKDRRRTGRVAIEEFRPDVIVLDDGMQFYQLHRDLDIVLIDALRPFDNGWTFPRGLLREPPDHLSRAGCIVLTNVDRVLDSDVAALSAHVKQLAPNALVFYAGYEAEALRALDNADSKPASWLDGRKVASFCALGNPEGFEKQLTRAGAELVHKSRFRDHYTPTMGDLNEAIEAAVKCRAEAIVVTEKDAVKLPPLGRPLPFYALEVNLQLNDKAAFMAAVLKAVAR